MNTISLIRSINNHIKVSSLSRKGVKISKHIVVFESDDWGSIRMPSLEARSRLLKKGVALQSPSCYDLYDTLASEDDLALLMEVLYSVRDSNNNPAVITLDTIVANPDFVKIRESDFKEYYYEPFTETLKRYPRHKNSIKLWHEGIEKKMFRPQFHGREHLNVQVWMRCLQQKEQSAMLSFDEGYYSMLSVINGRPQRVLEAYNAFSDSDYPFMEKSIEEGLDIFENIFGYRSTSMIAPCYTWDEPIETASSRAGVRILQGNVYNSHSFYYSQFMPHQTPRLMGQQNALKQCYLVRNCIFEPTQTPKYDKNRCLRDIERQFKLNHPAIVSCHRLNFIGSLIPENRNQNLKNFKELLHTIVNKWPDVVFMSSDQLGELLLNDGE